MDAFDKSATIAKGAGLLACLSLALAASTGGAAAAGNSSSLAVGSFTADFSAMGNLKDLALKGKGKIGILLPETTTSARYTSFDAPYLTEAFAKAGLSPDQFIITNAQGSESTQLTQAQSDISQGASVLLIDPISSGVGASVESYAKEHGVAVIDYDRLTLGGDRSYYVSFDNVEVGKKIGEGMVACIEDWKIEKPQVLIMRGAPTDNNATLFAEGYDGVLEPHFKSGGYTKVGEPAGTWDPAKARTIFEEQYTAHNDINAVVTPNDDNANAVISYLRTLHVPPQKFPTTGQDATLTGLQNVLAGYQCGTVYKPIYLEAQAAAALGSQSRKQRAEADQQEAIVTAAEATAAQVRAELAAPLIEQATADATARLAARERMWAASTAHGTARRLSKRRMARAVATASEEHSAVEAAGRARWRTLPETAAGVETWAVSVAQREADTDPRVTEAQERAGGARHQQHQLVVRQMQERADLRRQVFGDRKPSDPRAKAARWQELAESARRDLAAIEALPPVEAAQLIHDRAEQAQARRKAAELAAADRSAQLQRQGDQWFPTRHQSRPERGAPSL